MRKSLIGPAIFTAISLVILLALGAWQWRRMGEKQALVQTIEARIGRPPQALPSAGATVDPDVLEYTPVALRGRFTGPEAHVFFSLSQPIRGVSGPGYLVLQPLQLDDGRLILVNRGFVPVARKDDLTPAGRRMDGEVQLTGLLRKPERANPFTGADDPAKNVYYLRDPARLAAGLKLDRSAAAPAIFPMVVDLVEPVPAGGLPVPGTTQVVIANNHLQYALTWWSLAAVLAVIFGLFARSRSASDGPR